MDYLWKVSSKAKDLTSQISLSQMLSQKDSETTDEKNNKGENAMLATDDKPVSSSLSLETQQGNSDRDISSESEGIEAESPPQSKVGNESTTAEASDNSKRGSIQIGISAGDIKDTAKDVSAKAVESAKSIGSFLYGFANKTSRTLAETAKQFKTTVEENSILGDFNKEQEAFASTKNGDSKGEADAPWVGAENEEDLKQQILSLSADRRNFVRSPPTGVLFDFNFDTMHPVAKTMLKEDPALEKMRFDIVPKLINEETFWKNYFYRVSLVKQSSRLNKKANRRGSSSSGSSPEEAPRGSAKDDDWEKEMQQELQEYEVVDDGNEEDPYWEKEIEQMLEDKVKDVV